MKDEIINSDMSTRAKVIDLAEHYKKWGRDEPESTWMNLLVEEVGELGAALNGRHKHSPDYELVQIAAICINWLDKRQAAIAKLEE